MEQDFNTFQKRYSEFISEPQTVLSAMYLFGVLSESKHISINTLDLSNNPAKQFVNKEWDYESLRRVKWGGF